MNWGNFLGIGLYLLLLSGAIYKIYRDKKAGKTRCSSCPARGTCTRNLSKTDKE